MKKPFEAIVLEHGATVLRVCRAIVGPVDGDDAWSETFLAALQAYPQLPSDANVQAWLVTIAHRKALDILRRSARTVAVEAVPEPAYFSSDHLGGSVEELVSALEVWQTVQLLPQRQRLVIAYRYLGGLSYLQIVELIGGTEAAARRACADGLQSLRSKHTTALVDSDS